MNTPIWQLTVGEFLELQKRSISPTLSTKEIEAGNKRKLVYGLKGISELFQCSISTAQKIKNNGLIDKAITQFGRKIIVDADMALKLVKEHKVKIR